MFSNCTERLGMTIFFMKKTQKNTKTKQNNNKQTKKDQGKNKQI